MTYIASVAGQGPHRDLDKEKFWRKTLREQAASGQGVRASCAARGLSEPSFYFWRQTLARRDRTTVACRSETEGKPTPKRPTFVELCPQQPVSQAAPDPAPQTADVLRDDVLVELVAGERRLLIRSGCDRVLLREVLAALEG